MKITKGTFLKIHNMVCGKFICCARAGFDTEKDQTWPVQLLTEIVGVSRDWKSGEFFDCLSDRCDVIDTMLASELFKD